MTIMGVRDVPVRGLDKNYNFIKVKDQVDTVDLIYASAVPLDSYGNPNTKNVIAIANLTIFSQYLGAMRLAVLRGNCDLYLMPLGGNAFGNKFDHIKAAIAMAYNVMEFELKQKNINVKVLVWEGDGTNRGEEERKAFGFKEEEAQKQVALYRRRQDELERRQEERRQEELRRENSEYRKEEERLQEERRRQNWSFEVSREYDRMYGGRTPQELREMEESLQGEREWRERFRR